MKKKIVFGITSLTLGGAEKVLVDIANRLKGEYDITIFTIYAKGEFEKELDPSIHIESLYQKSYQELSKVQRRPISLRLLLFGKKIYQNKIQGKYDVEIAFLEGPITRLFHFHHKQTKKIVWIHNDISRVFGDDFASKIKKKVDKKIYRDYDKLVFVSQDNLKKFQEQYPNMPKEKMKVIYNYINPKIVLEKAEEKIDFELDSKRLNIGVVARLTKQKGIERLVKVHAKLKQEGYLENIYVIGEGPQRKEIEDEIKENKVEDSFFLLGKKENPYPYIKKMDVIALVSYYEGYGMVLEEAKILNKKIFITDTAAREALKNTNNHIIVDNSEEGILQGLKVMIEEKQNEKWMMQKEEYENESIIKKIKEEIEE